MEKNYFGIWIGAAIALSVIIVAVSVPREREPAAPGAPATPPKVASASTAPIPQAAPKTASTAPPSAPAPQAPSTTPRAIVATQPDPDSPPPPPKPELPPATRQNVRQAIDDLDIVIRDFRNALGGNPVGTNAEITSALLGDNLKQVKLKLPDNSQLNGNGELCDIWGTPYFFHQVSGTMMEIRSAGPDRKLWTGDDITR